ncbi:MAG TPA: hypothetical protein VND64_18820 [Pirellulales bacterium]|nr:hypothetical protein [Pirellulales bacterium]
MSTRVNQFCNSLRARLDTVEGRLKSMNSSLQALPLQAERSLGERLDLERRRAQPQAECFDEYRARLKAWAQRNMAKTSFLLSEWRAREEARALHARAARAEAYAVGAIDHALDAIEEAEELIRDAVDAGIDADSAALGEGPGRGGRGRGETR